MTDYYSDFRDYLVNHKSNSENTRDSYLRDVGSFLDFIANRGIASPLNVDEKLIDGYIGHLRDIGRSNTTISRNASSLRCFYKFLIFSGVATKDPTRNIKLEKNQKKLPQVLTGEEIDSLLSQPVLTEPKGCRDKAMLELLYATGIRVSELINLNVSDINLRTGMLHCKSAKSERHIPVYTSAIVAVSDYIYRMRSLLVSDESNDSLFVNLNGSRLTRQGFWKIIKGYAVSAGITKELTPHTLRHSFALHLLENGASVKDIQAMMGHADISSTQVYVQLLDNHMKSVYNDCHPKAKAK